MGEVDPWSRPIGVDCCFCCQIVTFAPYKQRMENAFSGV